MIAFIDNHRDEFGVGSICRVLPIAPSSYYARLSIRRSPDKASDRARKDDKDAREIRRVFDASRGRYGARKVWHQLRREGYDIARCTVERLMKVMGVAGCYTRQEEDHDPGPCTGLPGRQGQSRVHGHRTKPALGLRLHLCVDLGGNGLRGLCH